MIEYNIEFGGIILNEIKQLDKSYNEEIVAMNQFAFQYELTEQEQLAEINKKSDAQIWGWITDDQLAAKVHVIPLSTYINGQLFEMGGIAAVATWPEYRRQGMIKKLLYHSLTEMRNNGQTVSFLSPFSFPFYRKHGWELIFTNKEYQVPISYFKQDWQANGYLRRVKLDTFLLNRIYQSFAKKYTGMLNRTEKWWRERILKNAKQIAVAYSDTNEPEGYVIYDVKDSRFTIKDYAYSSLNGQKLLLEFISNHDASVEQVELTVPENDQLALLLNHPTFEQKVNHYFMGRIVDVLGFLGKFPFNNKVPNGSISITVEDGFFAENSGTYQLTSSASGVDVAKIDQNDSDIKVSIQMLTMLFLGYKRPLELYHLGLIQGDFEAIEQLEAFIPVQQTYITPADHF